MKTEENLFKLSFAPGKPPPSPPVDQVPPPWSSCGGYLQRWLLVLSDHPTCVKPSASTLCASSLHSAPSPMPGNLHSSLPVKKGRKGPPVTTGQGLFHLYWCRFTMELRSLSKSTQRGMMEQPAKSSCLPLSSTCSMGQTGFREKR